MRRRPWARFWARSTVKRVPNSRLLDVTFATTDPKLAADIVNAHIDNYIEQNFRSHYEATTQASNWLAGQLDELKSKVEHPKTRASNTSAIIRFGPSTKSKTYHQKLSDLNRELTAAQAIGSTKRPSISW